jgi:hypothetical protein
MTFVLRYRPEVIADLDAGRRWYEDRSAGLGSDFIVKCSEALARISVIQSGSASMLMECDPIASAASRTLSTTVSKAR